MAKCYRVGPSGVKFQLPVTPANEYRGSYDRRTRRFDSVRIGDGAGSGYDGFISVDEAFPRHEELRSIAFTHVRQGRSNICLAPTHDAKGGGRVGSIRSKARGQFVSIDGQALVLCQGFERVTMESFQIITCPFAGELQTGERCGFCHNAISDRRHVAAEFRSYETIRQIFDLEDLRPDDEGVVLESGSDYRGIEESLLWFLKPIALRATSNGSEWRIIWDGHFLKLEGLCSPTTPIEDEEVEMGEPPISSRDLRGHD